MTGGGDGEEQTWFISLSADLAKVPDWLDSSVQL